MQLCPRQTQREEGIVKDFIEQLNDLVAPMTRAYSDPEILKVQVMAESTGDDCGEFVVTLRCRRKWVSYTVPGTCKHERLDNEGWCINCGADRREG